METQTFSETLDTNPTLTRREDFTVNYVGFEVLASVIMKSMVFWDVTPCSSESAEHHCILSPWKLQITCMYTDLWHERNTMCKLNSFWDAFYWRISTRLWGSIARSHRLESGSNKVVGIHGHTCYGLYNICTQLNDFGSIIFSLNNTYILRSLSTLYK
jgi:hypothetical protein